MIKIFSLPHNKMMLQLERRLGVFISDDIINVNDGTAAYVTFLFTRQMRFNILSLAKGFSPQISRRFSPTGTKC
jgi:hypothetical protein